MGPTDDLSCCRGIYPSIKKTLHGFCKDACMRNSVNGQAHLTRNSQVVCKYEIDDSEIKWHFPKTWCGTFSCKDDARNLPHSTTKSWLYRRS